MLEGKDDHSVEMFEAADGTSIRYRHWNANDPRGVVVYLHGVESHSGWYVGSCQALCNAGYRVLAPDRRGSGLNSDNRGDTPSYATLLEDLRDFIKQVAVSENIDKVNLIAVSWGAKLACCLAGASPELVHTLALISPGLVPKVGFTLWKKLRIGFDALVAPQRLHHVPIDRPELFTSTAERIAYIMEDPLKLENCTARFMVESCKLDRYVRKCISRVTAPVLLHLAQNDGIIDTRKTIHLFKRFASRDRIYKLFPAASHTLEFDPDPLPFITSLVSWIDQRNPKPDKETL